MLFLLFAGGVPLISELLDCKENWKGLNKKLMGRNLTLKLDKVYTRVFRKKQSLIPWKMVLKNYRSDRQLATEMKESTCQLNGGLNVSWTELGLEKKVKNWIQKMSFGNSVIVIQN